MGIGIYRASVLGDKKAMSKPGYEGRIFGYHPSSCRVSLFFFAYQSKNMIDTIAWNDGPEFIFHHALSMMVSGGSIYPGLAVYYGSFFLGLSEISTAVLCILANFDPKHGVIGLGDSFPLVKIVSGAIFMVSFIVCRCIMWPVASYYFVRDCRWALDGNSPSLEGRRTIIKAFMFCLSGLSVLQILWLGQIFVVASEELKSMGLI